MELREVLALAFVLALFLVIAAGVWLLDLMTPEEQGDMQGYTGGYGGIQGDTAPLAPAQDPVRTRRGRRRGP